MDGCPASPLSTRSWSAVKLDLYGLKFYYTHVLRKPWVAVDLMKPPKARRLPDIVTGTEDLGHPLIFQHSHHTAVAVMDSLVQYEMSLKEGAYFYYEMSLKPG